MRQWTQTLISGFVLVLLGCGGETSASPADASPSTTPDATAVDSSADTTVDRCPASQPSDGYDCFDTNDVGLQCAYGGVVCVCKNLGQNSATWSCAPPDGGADAGALDCT